SFAQRRDMTDLRERARDTGATDRRDADSITAGARGWGENAGRGGAGRPLTRRSSLCSARRVRGLPAPEMLAAGPMHGPAAEEGSLTPGGSLHALDDPQGAAPGVPLVQRQVAVVHLQRQQAH